MYPLSNNSTLPLPCNQHEGSETSAAPLFSSCYAACEAGNLVELKSYLTQDPSLISQVSCNGQTLMHIAVEKDHFQLVEWLHQQDSTLIYKTDKNQLTPLHVAAFNEQIAILKLFITELKANAPLILKVAQKNCPKTLAFILENDIDPNTENSSLQTLLHLAAKAGLEKNVVCLLQHGAKVNALDLSKRTPLFLAIIKNHRSIVKLLIQNNADLNTLNEEKETVLHIAAACGHIRILKELLKSPVCKKMINAKDLDGKTALHKAVWGEQKHDIVNILLEHQADPNAKNNYGYTPLHWAAKHGHIKSAQALLRMNLIDSTNDEHHLPFDLAIRFDQDDFVHFFLGTKERLQIGKPSSDLEGFYSKCLLQAKKENSVGEQILYLLKLSTIYIDKAEKEKEKDKKEKFLTVGANIVNCAITLLGNENSLFQYYLFKILEEIEKLFLNTQGAKIFIKKNGIKDTRERLKEIRETAETSQQNGMPIQDTLQGMTQGFKQILSQLITDAQDLLGPSPVSWACIGMGSMSRGEMCPYSDIEFAFVIEKENPKALEYFRTLSKIIELKVINLGETKFPVFGGAHDSPTPDGFCLDSAGNTPLGVPGIYELIGTPKQLAQFQSVKWMERNIILPNAMSNVCLIAGEQKLEAAYNKQKRKVQQLQEKKEGMKRKNDEELAMRLLGGHLIEFSPDLSKAKEVEKAFGIKKELYRPFQEILGCLSILYNVKNKSTFNRIDELVELGVLCADGGKNLKNAIGLILTLRLQAHLFYRDEKEFLCHSENNKSQDSDLFYFDDEKIKMLHEIYKVLLPFHKAATKFYRTKNKETLYKSTFYEDTPAVQAATFKKTLQYAKAKEAYQQAISLNPNDVDTLLKYALMEDIQGNFQEALQRNEKALELAKQKYGPLHYYTGICYNNIGALYTEADNHEKALDNYMQSLMINIAWFGSDSAKLAILHNNVGATFGRLGRYIEAFEHYEKSLKINVQVNGAYHASVAISYNNIGAVSTSLGNHQQALEYMQKALAVNLQVLGEIHPSVAACYGNISCAYDNLGKYQEALESNQKELKIQKLLLEADHPDIGKCYNNIACVYTNLNQHENANKFFKKALEIFSIKFHINHSKIAVIYNNIGKNCKELKNFQAALENYQKCLEIELKVFNENHPSIATTYHNLSGIYGNLADCDNQLLYSEKALEIRQNTLDKSHPDIASSWNMKGLAHANREEYEKAGECYQTALSIYEKAPSILPQMFTVYDNIGFAYSDCKDYVQSIKWFELCLSKKKEFYGEKHLKVAQSYLYLAMRYDYIRNDAKAFDYYQKSIESCDEEAHLFQTYKCMASTFLRLKDKIKTFEYSQKAEEINIRKLEKNNPKVADHYLNTGITYLNLGCYDQAIENLNIALALHLEIYGKVHLNTAKCYRSFAYVYKKIFDDEKALAYLEKVLEIKLQLLGPSHIGIALAYFDLASSSIDCGYYENAYEFGQKELAIRLNFGKFDNDLENAYHILGCTCNMLEKPEEALYYHLEALKINLKITKGDEKHDEIARNYRHLGKTYEKLGEFDKSLKCLQKALQINLKVTFGYSANNHISCYLNIGQVFFALKDYKKSIEYYQKVLNIKDKPEELLRCVTDAHEALGISLRCIGNDLEALENFKEASRIAEKIYHKNHLKRLKLEQLLKEPHETTIIPSIDCSLDIELNPSELRKMDFIVIDFLYLNRL